MGFKIDDKLYHVPCDTCTHHHIPIACAAAPASALYSASPSPRPWVWPLAAYQLSSIAVLGNDTVRKEMEMEIRDKV
jgi:hypothetical protein